MSNNPNSHPARSPEFLSRLHDQELSPAERAHFESHRAHCAECRTAAAEFEGALALFRSSGPKPASPDLAARILRKLQQNQASTRRRLHFGPSFGIDLRWAGAFAAAVIAAVVASSVIVQNESRSGAIHVRLPATASEEAMKKAEEPASRPVAPGLIAKERGQTFGDAAARARSKGQPSFDAPAPAAESKPEGYVESDKFGKADKDEKAAGLSAGPAPPNSQAKQKEEAGKLQAPAYQQAAPAAPPSVVRQSESQQREEPASGFTDRVQQSQAASNALPADERKRSNARQSQKSAARNDLGEVQNQSQTQNRNLDIVEGAAQAAPSVLRDGERQGGEGGTGRQYEGLNAAGVRLIVSPLDGAGAAPELLTATAVEIPASLKGQEFIVVVDLAGRVIQVAPRHAESSEARPANEKRLAKAPLSPLAAVRFQPPSQQRRLLVRVE